MNFIKLDYSVNEIDDIFAKLSDSSINFSA